MFSTRVERFSLVSAVSALILTGCAAARSDNDLRAELLEMARADQEVREQLMAVLNLSGSESVITGKAQVALKEMAAVDERNQLRLEEIVSQRGWPGSESVGREAASAALLIIEHSDVETKERYLPLLRQAVEEGQEESSRLAELEDEVSVANTGYQIYGTEISLDSGVPVLVPILDLKGLETRRAEMGLQPMEEYLKSTDRNAIAEFGVAVDRTALSLE